ncbi:hypothetical protein MBM_08174 [Drepanopeziza brunnea f. sp. 'multigermtubi' MB_m1]|uniref:Uncharacterized protein n=1 Tax=Marssonina brunnea f. sp. multigermtubi (strain MB_m1) TaxID=1072389 RepID=K1WKR3_MARBU|nr:uncharacterized protein MBM_08174 [Drepanopeziza brunnea f. sp. 'multigermtubi' MB_m1]EKD13456.1 hypothetical protein MBM_08174 [Drepanopeziza brunnea f. sp. 'multigermtubi' MB_m1]
MNTGLKIYTTLSPLTPLAPPLGLAPVMVDPAIFYAFMTIRMLLPSTSKALCFSGANITDFIEKYEEIYKDFSIFQDDRIEVASVEINAAVRDKAKKPFPPSERSKPTRIKKNVRQQREKNYGTFKARAFQESGTIVKIDLKDKLFDSVIEEESSRPSRPARADEAIEDMEEEVEIT